MALGAAQQPQCEAPRSPVILGSSTHDWTANNLKLGRIVTKCGGSCPEKANMEEMPGVVPRGPVRFCETGSAGGKGYQIAGTINFGRNFLLG
ncbi:hypothetical protein WBO78_19170 [Bosea sp. CCNWLW174]|uniref:hypothetical protein n=1 Tax=unclassified Bosea (in: a-proteobacteria) TaxID=2653178 RepID=UPI0030154350